MPRRRTVAETNKASMPNQDMPIVKDGQPRETGDSAAAFDDREVFSGRRRQFGPTKVPKRLPDYK